MSKRAENLWRSIEELEARLASDAGFREAVTREFPVGAELWKDPVSRRRFLQIMGASLALAGLNGCTWFPPEHAMPYVNAPEDVIPGKPLFYASSFVMGGFAKGILAETHMARPTKIEGNPGHPASLGGTDVFMQGALLDLYDPGRGKVPLYRGEEASWDDFYAHLASVKFSDWEKTRGRGLRLLSATTTSPTLAALFGELLKRYPGARWYAYEPVNRDNISDGAQLAFGRAVDPIYHLERAKVIVSLGADFLLRGPAGVRQALEFADQRRLRPATQPQAAMNRLYMAETSFSITGAMAEHRLPASAARLSLIARALARELGAELPGAQALSDQSLNEDEGHWLQAAARDLGSHRGEALVIAGDDQPASVHALAHLMNQKLGAEGKTVSFIPAVEASPPGQLRSLVRLCEEMRAGEVDSLFILGTDPAFTAPDDLGFRDLMGKVKNRYCQDVYPTETAFYSDWYLPQTHYLEEWGDPRAFDGTVSLQQPVVAPLFQGKGQLELLSALLKRPGAPGNEILRNYWSDRWKPYAKADESFESFWERVLRDGLIRDSASHPVDVTARPDIGSALKFEEAKPGFEIHFEPDPRIWDGRYASNTWLQELPKPLTQLTWDNAALVSYATAKKFRLSNQDVIRIEIGSRILELPVFVLAGHADGAVTLYLGYGGRALREYREQDEGGGFNAYLIRTSDAPWNARGAKLSSTGIEYKLASSQHHQDMAGRDMVEIGTLLEYARNPNEVFSEDTRTTKLEQPLPNLYPQFAYRDEAWAMVIDLTVCIGCKVCTIACQAENNIPIVGKSEVRNKREMHWIRVDRYFYGAPENPGIAFQPVPCMHCERAPCEYVCPVEATVHDSSGINEMVYNRCIGTRDCSNNCPYKVRRFNFLQYSEEQDPLKKLVYNPDVTVRERGVMEKCTYCIQRINTGRIRAHKEDRKILPGEVVPACAQACPTRAIVFGNKNDARDQVTTLKKHPLNYGLLEEQGTQPRTTYLAKIRNPNPALEGA